jgi:hypothetical protein
LVARQVATVDMPLIENRFVTHVKSFLCFRLQRKIDER